MQRRRTQPGPARPVSGQTEHGPPVDRLGAVPGTGGSAAGRPDAAAGRPDPKLLIAASVLLAEAALTAKRTGAELTSALSGGGSDWPP